MLSKEAGSESDHIAAKHGVFSHEIGRIGTEAARGFAAEFIYRIDARVEKLEDRIAQLEKRLVRNKSERVLFSRPVGSSYVFFDDGMYAEISGEDYYNDQTHEVRNIRTIRIVGRDADEDIEALREDIAKNPDSFSWDATYTFSYGVQKPEVRRGTHSYIRQRQPDPRTNYLRLETHTYRREAVKKGKKRHGQFAEKRTKVYENVPYALTIGTGLVQDIELTQKGFRIDHIPRPEE